MARCTKVTRNCDHCGRLYTGYGDRFCGLKCNGAAAKERAGSESAPREPDESVTVKLESDYGHIAVAASSSIKTPEELIERAGIDLETWEPFDPSVRKWDTVIKVGEDPVVVPLYYVSVKLRKRWEATDLPRPVVLKVTRPSSVKPVAGDLTTVVWPDVHVPHHDERAVNIAQQITEYLRPGQVAQIGDLLDCEQISRYPKDPFNRVSLKEEIEIGAKLLGTLHAITPHAEHLWFEGNHEERLKRLIWSLAENRQAGEILALDGVRAALDWGQLLGLDALGWQITPYPKHQLLHDRLILKHGSSVRRHSAYTAKEEHDKYGKSGMSGHTHRLGAFYHRDYNGAHAWFELGLLGQIREDYVDHANWQQGMGVITWSEDRTRFGVELVSIHDGVCYFRGKRFTGNSRDLAA